MKDANEEMATATELIRELRDLTGAGIMDCRRALQESDNDLNKAMAWLREKGMASVGKKLGREAKQGLIESYVHGGRLGALIELNCETDFVARTDEFRTLAREIAMHVAVMDVRYLSDEHVPGDVAASYPEGKSRDDFLKSAVLLRQPHIRNADTSVGDMIREAIAKLGENIVLRRFARFQLGSEE